jgi:carbon-monoxide dehydrogenase medium subunit
MEGFIIGAFATTLADDEVLVGLRIPKLSSSARWGHYKFCRKPGEFAEAVGGVLSDPERGIARGVIGAGPGAPYVIEPAHFLVDGFDDGAAMSAIEAAGLTDDTYDRQVHWVALKRASMRLNA